MQGQQDQTRQRQGREEPLRNIEYQQRRQFLYEPTLQILELPYQNMIYQYQSPRVINRQKIQLKFGSSMMVLNVSQSNLCNEIFGLLKSFKHRLLILNLSGNPISDQICKSENIFSKQLVELDVSFTNLTDVSIKIFSQRCPKLIKIDLTYCQITQDSIDYLQSFNLLQSLSILFVQLSYQNYPAKYFKSVQNNLHVAKDRTKTMNKIIQKLLHILNGLINLKELTVNSCSSADQLISNLSEKMNSLYIYSEKHLDQKSIEKIRKFNMIWLRFPDSCLSFQLPNLNQKQMLMFIKNQAVTQVQKSLEAYQQNINFISHYLKLQQFQSKVRMLKISKRKLQQSDMQFMALKLKNTEFLDLTQTDLTDKLVQYLNNMQQLIYLNLDDNKDINNESVINLLPNLKHLKILSLNNNNELKQKIMERYPKLIIATQKVEI